MYVTSCDERRIGEWDHISWADYIGTATRSKEYETLLADGIIRNLAAMKSSEASTHWPRQLLGLPLGRHLDQRGAVLEARLLHLRRRHRQGQPVGDHLRLGHPRHVHQEDGQGVHPKEIAAETWAQIKAHVNKPFKRPVLTDDMLHTWYLDPAVIGAGTSAVTNEDPLFVQSLGAYELRPTSATRIPNFFLAGDWVQTNLYVSTMETANEGGRHAANALLDAAGYSGSKATLADLWIPPAFDDGKRLDRDRYRKGQKHILDD